jgi:translation initiation factor RLI1
VIKWTGPHRSIIDSTKSRHRSKRRSLAIEYETSKTTIGAFALLASDQEAADGEAIGVGVGVWGISISDMVALTVVGFNRTYVTVATLELIVSCLQVDYSGAK